MLCPDRTCLENLWWPDLREISYFNRLVEGCINKVVSGVLFPGGGESPTFPQVRLGCPSLWSAISGISALAGRVSGSGLWWRFSNFRFGGAETGSTMVGSRFRDRRRPASRAGTGRPVKRGWWQWPHFALRGSFSLGIRFTLLQLGQTMCRGSSLMARSVARGSRNAAVNHVVDGRRIDQQMNELRDLEVVRRYRWIIQIRHDQILLRGVRIGLDPPHRGPVNAAALECGSLQIRPDQQCCHQ